MSRAGYAVLLFGLIVSLGMEGYVTRAIARTPERASELVSAVIVVRLALMLPVLAGLLLYVYVARIGGQSQTITYILFGGMVVGTLAAPLTSFFVGRERLGFSAAGAVIGNLLELGLVGLVVLVHGGVLLFAATNVLMSLVQVGLNLFWARDSLRLYPRVSLALMREVAQGGLGFWIGGVLYNVYLYIDAILLGYLAGDTAVGIYGPATRMFAVPLFLPGIIATTTLPLLSRLGIGVQHDFARVARKTLSLLIVSSVPLAIGLATFAGPLILTIFRHKYAASVPVLQVLCLCVPSTFVAIQFYQMVVARDQQSRWNIIMAAGCVVNPALNILLIPYAVQHWHNGALGSAWSLVVTEGMMVVYGVFVLRDVVLHRELARTIASALAAGVLQGGVIFLAWRLWPPVNEALGVAAYAIGIFVFGALPREDILLLWQTGLGQAKSLYTHIRPGSAAVITPPDPLR